MVKGHARGSDTIPPRRPRLPAWLLLLLTTVFVAMLVSACGNDPNQATAQHNKARLDAELHHAEAVLGVPQPMLLPITQKEQRVASGAGGWNYKYGDAAANYALLYTQLVGIEQTSTDTLSKQAQADVDAFSAAVQRRRSDGFTEVTTYQTRLDQAVQELARAKVPGDFVQVDAFARAQTEALQTMWPAYQKLQDYKSVLQSVGSSGINTSLAQTEYTGDLQAFRAAGSGVFYTQLGQQIDGQIMQLMADQSEAMPYVGAALLNSLKARIDLLASYGQDATTFSQAYAKDASLLPSAHTLADYLSLAQSINGTVADMALPLARGQAYHDLSMYRQLLATTQNLTTPSPYDSNRYPATYEYTSAPTNGIADVTDTLAQAQTLADYQAVDDDIYILTTGLRAMIDNMSDPTPHWLPHKTDLELLQDYGILSGKALVVSLREQTIRLYDNGQLVYWSYVTTGRPELPSPPGLHYAIYKVTHTEFTSAEPVGSPFWYAPTPINYAILYANYGFFVHDAWWRTEFGPGSNLPHWDPAAFNGGSHGCVNLPENNMVFVYNWTPVGTPILLY